MTPLPTTCRQRLALGMPLIVALTLGAALFGVARHQVLGQAARQDSAAAALARGLAVGVADRLEARDGEGLQRILEGIAGYPDLDYAMVLDAEGRVLAHSDRRRLGLQLDPGSRETSPMVLRGRAWRVEASQPVRLAGHPLGSVRIALDGRSIRRTLHELGRDAAVSLVVASLLTLLSAAWLSGLLARRLARLTTIAAAVTAGNLQARAGLTGSDEAAALARQFDAMLDRLQARHEELDAFLDAAPDGILVLDDEGRILRANTALGRLFGYPAAALVGQGVETLMPERFRTGHPEKRRRYLQDRLPRRETIGLDLRGLRRDGRELPVSINLNLVEGAEGRRVICVVHDMTRREQVETELRLSLDRLETAASAGIVGIWDWDVVNDRLIWDSAMYKLYGCREEDFGGAYDAWASAVHPADRARAEAAIGAALRGEHDYDPEFRIRRRDGSVRYIKAAARTFHDGAGRPVRMVGVNYDLTELKRHERQLAAQGTAARRLAADLQAALRRAAESNRALQVANQELESFSYSVSHDLRAPLRSVDGFSQILLRGYADRLDEQGRELLQRMRAGAQRMGQLIDDMLLLSRISRAELERRPIDLGALAEAAVAQLREADPERQVEVVIAPGLTAEADGHLVRILLDNLLGNAWKFTARTPGARIEFGAAAPSPRPAWFVRDNGAGFDMAYADKLFGAFQRLHSASEFPGSGIGLATVMRVVHKHGGQVRAEGAVGQGATFWFSLQP